MTDHIQILYIDDDQFLRDIVKQFLEREEGWMVTTAESAIDATHLLTEKVFDAVISDYEMEQMDGIELLKHLRKKGDTIPFIIFTGKGREEVVIDALNNGADFYLQKGGQSTTLFTELSNKILYAVSRRRAEKDLIESQKRIAEVIETLKIKEFAIESSLNGIAITDLSGILTYVNPGLLDIWGYSRSDIIIGKTWSDLWENEGDAKVVEASIRETGRWSGELVGIQKDKKIIVLIVSANLICDISGVPIGMYGSFFDITEQKYTEKALKESERKLSSILNYLTDAIWSLTWPEMDVLYISPSAEKIFGRPVQDFIENLSLWADITHPDDVHITKNALEQLIKEGSAVRECRIIRPDGSIVWIQDKSNLIFDENNNPIRVDGIASDITERKVAEEALAESEKQHRDLFESSHDAIMILEPPSWKFTSCNQATVELFEANSKNEFVSLGPWDVSPKHQPDGWESHEKVKDMIEMALCNRSHYFEWTHKKIRGPAFPSTVLLTRMDRLGTVFLQATVRDITEQKKTESDLMESRERFRQLAEVFPETIFEADNGGTITYMNTHGLKQFGYSPEYLSKNINIYNLVSSDYRDQVFRRVQEKIQGIDNGYMEYQALRADGSAFWAMGLSVPILKNGVTAGVRGFILDITKRKQAEEDLIEVTDRLSLATLAGGVGIWDWDLVRNILTWDDQMFRLYGIEDDQHGDTYETWRARILPQDLERSDNEIRMALTGEFEFNTEFRIIWPDESIHTIRALALVQRDVSGTPVRMIGTNWDITEVKLQEENIRNYSLILEERNADLEQVRKELATLNNDLEVRVLDRTKEVEELLCHKDQFIEMVGHDLKTPLTPLCALLPLLLRDEQNPESREIISMLIKDVTFMREHIGKVLSLARLNRGSPLVDLKKINVRMIVDEVIKSYHYSIQEKDLIIHNQVDDDLTLLMNSLHLEVMVRNILENAIKYSGHRGVVILSGVSDRDYITLSISDTGIGMSPDEIVLIFNEFYRADASRHERDSHGLGLSIVKRIVVLYQGNIHAESQGKGMGSTIIIRLPKKKVTNFDLEQQGDEYTLHYPFIPNFGI